MAVYARVSTDMEIQLHSLEEQMRSFRAKIAQHPGWTLVDVYADKGISGTSVKKRTEFLRMMKDCEDGKVDYVMTKSISRFARNTVECLSYDGTEKSTDAATECGTDVGAGTEENGDRADL